MNYLSLGQSNASDWLYSTQLLGSNSAPMWNGAPPADLVLTISIVDGRGCARISGRDYIAALPDGHITIRVPHGAMSALEAGLYDVHLQIDKTDARSEFVFGRLPIIAGAAL